MTMKLKSMSTDGTAVVESDSPLKLGTMGRLNGVEYIAVNVLEDGSAEFIEAACRNCDIFLGLGYRRVFRHEGRSLCPACARRSLAPADFAAQSAAHDAQGLPVGTPLTDAILKAPDNKPRTQEEAARALGEISAELAQPKGWIKRETAREMNVAVAERVAQCL